MAARDVDRLSLLTACPVSATLISSWLYVQVLFVVLLLDRVPCINVFEARLSVVNQLLSRPIETFSIVFELACTLRISPVFNHII